MRRMTKSSEAGNQSPQRKRPISTCWLIGLVLSCLTLLGRDFAFQTSHLVIQKDRSVSTVIATYEHKGNLQSLSLSHASILGDVSESKVFPRVCLDEQQAMPIWEWHHYSTETSDPTTRTRLLIATYSAFGKYARLLELTSPINKAYAKLWKHDIVVLQGTSLILPWDENCTPPEERSRFNKVDLLLMALKKKKSYDHFLLLDADALIYNFSFDVSRLVSNTTMLVAQRTQQGGPSATRSINNGITLWNLHHPLTSQVAQDWDRASRNGIPDNRPFRGDQYYLRQILKSEERIAAISSVQDEFNYRDGTVIKHFQRSNARSWNETGLDTREEKILNTTSEICSRFGIDETALDIVSYTKPMKVRLSNEICIPRRATDWDVIRFSTNKTTPASKRLLIAQYSSYGSYASLLEATAPINKAYAHKWSHDFLVVQGVALRLQSDQKECDTPPQRSMYNKIPILIHALTEKESYDQILILDADSLIYKMDFDVTSLLDEGDMLAAHRVNSNDTIRTWNINNGITLWNLNHHMTKRVAKLWLKRTTKALDGAHDGRWSAHGDQCYLHNTLKRQKGAIQYTKSLTTEFHYENGTIAKHFLRPKNNDWTGYGKDNREKKIQLAVEEICANFSSDCVDLEHISYSTK